MSIFKEWDISKLRRNDITVTLGKSIKGKN